MSNAPEQDEKSVFSIVWAHDRLALSNFFIRGVPFNTVYALVRVKDDIYLEKH